MSRLAPVAVPAAAALVFTGGLSTAYGSWAVIPGTFPGQIAVEVALGAALLLPGALALGALVALRPVEVERVLGLPAGLARGGRRRAALVALGAIAALAALLLASDVWAYTSLRWAVPFGGPVFVG